MNNKVTGCILAGGQGRRMGGRDKGLVELASRPLVAYAIERLAPQVGSIVISANRELDAYGAFDHEVLTDRTGDYQGPLAGVERALSECKIPYLVSVPCDLPLFPMNLVSRLYEAIQQGSGRIAVAALDGKRQNVVALWDKRCLPALQTFLAAGGRRVEDFLIEQNAVTVDFSDEAAAFDNVNTPEDLARLAQRLQRTAPHQ